MAGFGIEATAHGTVGRTFSTKNGAAFELLVMTRKNAQYADRVTVWGAKTRDGLSFEPNTDDVLSVSGFLTWSKTEKDGKTYLNVSLNDAVLVDLETAF